MSRLVALVLTLAVAAVAAPAAAQTTETRSISVQGTASRQIPNDAARFTTTVRVQRRTADAALAAASRRTRRVLSSLAELGVARVDTRTSSITLTRAFERDRRTGRLRLVGHRARTSVRATIRDLTRVGSAIAAVVRAGASDVGSVTFFVSDTDAVYREVLGEAFDEARAKAEQLAARAGLTLGPARAISEGTDEEFFTMELARGLAEPSPVTKAPPIRPGRTNVEATVSVVFDATAP